MTDVKITPASRKIEFFGSDDALDAAISTDGNGNLSITNVGGEISLGDTTADIHIGDGTNTVDLVFDQPGDIYNNTGAQLNIGSTIGVNGSRVITLADKPFRDLGTSSGNLNNDSVSGIYRFNTASNVPGGITYGTLVTFNNSSDTGFQLVGDYHETGLYWRGGNSSTFGGTGTNTNWFKIWHDGNDGAGSGLDADKLDGLQASQFLRSDLAVTSSGLHFNDNTTVTFGNTRGTPNLKIYHDGTNTLNYIEAEEGHLYIQNTADDSDIILRTDAGNGGLITYVWCDGSTGRVYLNYYGAARAYTVSDGLTVSGWCYTSSGIAHSGDSDTYITMTTDRMQYYCGGVEMLDMVEGTTDYVDIIDRVRVTSGGDMICEGDITAFTTTAVSDERRKDNIKVIDNALDKVSSLKGVTFNWKHNGQSSAGLIAQDVEKVLPDVVMEKEIRDEGTYKTVDYDGVIGLLVESIKELKAEIEVLKNGSTN